MTIYDYYNSGNLFILAKNIKSLCSTWTGQSKMEHGFNGFTLLNKMSVIILSLICHTAGLMIEMLEVLFHRVNGWDGFLLGGINVTDHRAKRKSK
ncbi:hypothetical protein A2V82_10700 [candidate division KSB1 bacterium RBG_16_48_16]|nr:MAG: hypothetical protein A2V82_10700 [candidate division KSB1 bacterium RBG_16_48_16]